MTLGVGSWELEVAHRPTAKRCASTSGSPARENLRLCGARCRTRSAEATASVSRIEHAVRRARIAVARLADRAAVDQKARLASAGMSICAA